MTNYPTAQQNYNEAGKPFHPFDFITITAISRDTGLPVTFHFSNRARSENVTV